MATEPSRLDWIPAKIAALAPLSARILRVELEPEHWHPSLPGQHVDVRLTAEDGYQAQRSYSLLAATRNGRYELAIEKLDEGEVSPYFHEDAAVGDELEVLGPVGGHFIWKADETRPVLLVGGGSGVVPLLAIARARMESGVSAPMCLLYGARTLPDIILYQQLLDWEAQDNGFRLHLALSRATQPPRPQDHPGRLNAAMVQQAIQGLGMPAEIQCYVCGSNGFVETATTAMLDAGLEATQIRTERFGG
ncbi:FAD-binding oxidoreductase [Thiothrix nivea]|uniref:Oxidoreductase FAD-binding domain protein n=1 Tax=Thiothrix nivea (strain ATCC 35100 / DSM 5205 / JP2) TaxID=870187 RepID=A0A656HGW7_THINJ|nr:FAD-binding oxidoreductase [Thiothrix nivea]EIJ35452.1 Oxidoreductase FAD-binding domain protein [Thiothrix nivea DSM 5205]